MLARPLFASVDKVGAITIRNIQVDRISSFLRAYDFIVASLD
jgi:hypothetical protein